MGSKLKVTIIVLMGALICWVLIIFASQGFPVPQGDAFAFLPPAISLASGKGLVNPIWDLASALDSTGQSRFIYYVPLFPLLVGHLMWAPTAACALIVVAFLNSLNILLCGVCFYKTVTWGNRPLTWLSVSLVCLALLGMATHFSDYDGGRPEILGTLLFLGAACSVLYAIRRPYLSILLGFWLGMMGATHPLGAILLSLLIGAFYAAHLRPRESLKTLSTVYLLSLAVFFAGLLLAPYSIADILGGTWRHWLFENKLVADHPFAWRDSLSMFMHYYFLNSNATGYGFMMLAALLAAARLYQRFHSRIATLPLFWFFIVSFSVVAFWVSLKISFESYNLLLFVPLFFGLCLYEGANFSRRIGLKQVAGIGILLITGVGFLRLVLLYPSYSAEGMSLSVARQQFQVLQQKTPGRIGVSRSTWMLTEDYPKIYLWEKALAKTGGLLGNNAASVLIFQQAYVLLDGRPAMKAPAQMEGHTLQAQFFKPGAPRLLGIKLARTIPGYQYAVYVPEKKNAKMP